MNTNILKTTFAALALLVVFNSCKEKEETKYLVTVSYDPEQGTVTGGGEYEEGEKATITAIANPGYCFDRWVGYTSKDSVITIAVTADKSYTAIFSKIESSEYGIVKITISDNGGYYLYEAKPNENCYFVKWSDGSYELSKNYVLTGETLTATFKPYPEGSIHALFFVSPTKRVIFSKGYLQFNPTLGTHTRADGTTAPGTWRFAENQTNMINSDLNVSATYDGWIDDFAWGTSGWSGSGATYYQPYDGYNSDDISEIPDSVGKLYGPQGEYDLTGDYAYADWGVYNPISNGGDKPGMWRTLTRDEFKSFLCTHYIEKYFRCLDGFVFYSGDYPLKDNEVISTPNDLSNYNNLVYLNNQAFKAHWTANYSGEVSARAIRVSTMLNTNMGWTYKRFSRLPVRLVMDVEE